MTLNVKSGFPSSTSIINWGYIYLYTALNGCWKAGPPFWTRWVSIHEKSLSLSLSLFPTPKYPSESLKRSRFSQQTLGNASRRNVSKRNTTKQKPSNLVIGERFRVSPPTRLQSRRPSSLDAVLSWPTPHSHSASPPSPSPWVDGWS